MVVSCYLTTAFKAEPARRLCSCSVGAAWAFLQGHSKGLGVDRAEGSRLAGGIPCEVSLRARVGFLEMS